MLPKILAPAVVAATLVTSPAAADHATFDCGYDSVSQETVTGADTFVGAAYGYVVSPTPEEGVSIRCFVMVNGVEATTTNPAAGTTAAVTAGRITFTAYENDTVVLCAEWSAGTEGGTLCYSPQQTELPPQGEDPVDVVLWFVLDLLAQGPPWDV